jgi:HEPN domain-containing protein
MKKHLEYLDIARQDLEASILLLEKGLCPQALYSTEQAVEKICKYVMLKDEILTEKELKNKIGHDPLKVFKTLTNYFLKFLDNSDLKTQYSDELICVLDNLKTDSKTFLQDIQSGPGNRKGIGYDPVKLDNYLDLLDTFQMVGENLQTQFNILFDSPETFIQLGKSIGIFDAETIASINRMFEREDTKQRAIEMMRQILDEAPLYQNLTIRLMFLATIFSYHLEQTRYPDLADGKLPNELFNYSNPLIMRLNKFNVHIESVMKGYNDIGI